MRVLTPQEASVFLTDPDHKRSFGDIKPRGDPGWQTEHLPARARGRTSLATWISLLLYATSRAAEVVLEIDEWNIFSDDPGIMDIFRESLGERRGVLDAPFHIFGAGEHESFQQMLILCSLFTMDALVYKPSTGDRLWVSHDDMIDFNFADREIHNNVARWLTHA